MIRQMADFASARSERPELLDVNQFAKAVCDFLSFDSRFRTTSIEFRGDKQLPACVMIPDHLNEVLMGVLQACVEPEPKPKAILLATMAGDSGVRIRIDCEPVSSSASSVLSGLRAGAKFESGISSTD